MRLNQTSKQFWNFWFRVDRKRALLEAWVLACIILFGITFFSDQLSVFVYSNVLLFTSAGAGFLAALRARMERGKGFWRTLLIEAVTGFNQGMFSMLLLLLLWAAGRDVLYYQNAWDQLFSLVVLACSGLAFHAMRAIAWTLDFWNRLRRKSLMWSLTHAQLLVVVIVALTGAVVATILLLTMGSIPEIYQDLPLPSLVISRLITTVLPVFGVVAVMTIIALFILLPPSALFSFFFARRTTRRLQRVVNAARRFRSGDYDARVEVEGEDEVGQLQADFNGLAETLEQTLKALSAERERVETLLHARRELIASVSHELRTPVATVRGYLDATLDNWENATPETLHEDLETMRRETIRLQGLIDDLFTLARVEVDNLPLELRPVDLAPLIRERVAAIAPLAWQTGRVEVLADMPQALPLAIADPTRLEQVLVNLLRNAIRFTPPGGIVAVTAVEEDGCLRMDVRDTGQGIPAQDLPHVFERFYRSSAKKVAQDGAGLGLALVKELTEAMGGQVCVESVNGEGSCFTVKLKLAA